MMPSSRNSGFFAPLRPCVGSIGCRASRRAETVEAGGIIRPLGIAEIGPAVGEGVGSYWRPGRAEQIRAGFHHDRDVCCPGDDEAEPVGFYTKTGTVVKDQWFWKEPDRKSTRLNSSHANISYAV